MRLKIFTADNMQAALSQVRHVLGDDAIIIDSVEEAGKVRVTAAVEHAARPRKPAPKPASRPAPREDSPPAKPGKKTAPQTSRQKSLRDLDHEDQVESRELSWFLSHHGIEPRLMARILDTAASFEADRNINLLARALDALFHFNPLNNDYMSRPVMLVGPPGVGKTVTAAKLASQAVLEGRITRLINTDSLRTGGTAQLQGYGEILKSTVLEVAHPDQLREAIDTHREPDELVIIDTTGYNPLDAGEMKELHRFILAHDVEPVLVVSAGTDPLEAQEIAQTYASIGVRRFIATRLDVARRYANLLATAGAGDLAFAGIGRTPYLAQGIEQVDAMGLARILTNIQDRKVYIPPEETGLAPAEPGISNNSSDADSKESKQP